MQWSGTDQQMAEAELAAYMVEFDGTYMNWLNGIKAGNAAQGKAAVEEILRRWRGSVENLRQRSERFAESDTAIQHLHQRVVELGEQRVVLRRLQSEAGTRADQADSLNPKVRPSPFTNILGLQRTFRDSTRKSILGASIVFGIFAVLLLAFLIYRVVTGSASVQAVPVSTTIGGFRGRGRG
jgi:hypothetical protein